MNKASLKYLLITEKKNWKYYYEDAERRQIFMEILESGFPYAIKVFSEAPAKFVPDGWEYFKNKKFKNVYHLYKQSLNEKEKIEYYCKAFENLSDKSIVLDNLKNEFWNKSTIDMLNFYKKCHSKFKNEKKVEKEIKDFHTKCIDVISKIALDLETLLKKATEILNEVELEDIKKFLCSDVYSDEYKANVQRLLKCHYENVTKTNFLREILAQYKTYDWLHMYILFVVENATDIDFDIFVIELFNHPAAEKIDNNILIQCFSKLSHKKQIKIFESISNIAIFDSIFKYYTANYNRPEEVKKIINIYLNKFKDSGNAIYNITDYVSKGKSTINTLPEIIEEYAKKWLISFNYHNKVNEIVAVVEALANVEKFDELFIDSLFWKKMENCNAFITVVENIAYAIGFQKCYDFILKNYLVAKAYHEKKLMSKWMQSANYIAVNAENAKESYIYFISKLLDEDSLLDNYSKNILTKEVIYNMLQQAFDSKKCLELEKRKSGQIKNECLRDFFFHTFESIDKLEKNIIAYSDVSDDVDDERMKTFRVLHGKVRTALSNVGLYTVVDVEDWVKRKTVFYDNNLHKCTEDIKNGELVICLTMGMKDANLEFFEKASVKLFRGEENNVNNI